MRRDCTFQPHVGRSRSASPTPRSRSLSPVGGAGASSRKAAAPLASPPQARSNIPSHVTPQPLQPPILSTRAEARLRPHTSAAVPYAPAASSTGPMSSFGAESKPGSPLHWERSLARQYLGGGTKCGVNLCPFVDSLYIPPLAVPISGDVTAGTASFRIVVSRYRQQLHRDLATTLVWWVTCRLACLPVCMGAPACTACCCGSVCGVAGLGWRWGTCGACWRAWGMVAVAGS